MRLTATLILLATSFAYAEPSPVPMPERGGSPAWLFPISRLLCALSQRRDAIIPQRNGSCPHGWTASGSFCLRSGRRDCYHGHSKCF